MAVPFKYSSFELIIPVEARFSKPLFFKYSRADVSASSEIRTLSVRR